MLEREDESMDHEDGVKSTRHTVVNASTTVVLKLLKAVWRKGAQRRKAQQEVMTRVKENHGLL